MKQLLILVTACIITLLIGQSSWAVTFWLKEKSEPEENFRIREIDNEATIEDLKKEIAIEHNVPSNNILITDSQGRPLYSNDKIILIRYQRPLNYRIIK